MSGVPRWNDWVAASPAAAVRAAEEQVMAGLPEGALMQRAAAALAAEVVGLLRETSGGVYGRGVVLWVGPGNNGGDALFAGARLAARGARVTALLVADRVHEAGLRAVRSAGGRTLRPAEVEAVLARPDDVAWVRDAAVHVDGLLGIGARPGLTGLAAEVATLRRRDAVVVAVDLPSGLGPDTGRVDGAHVTADLTVTFAAAKPCLLLPPACLSAGEIRVVDIGVDPAEREVARLDRAAVAWRWPVAEDHDDKYSRGVVGVVAGGATYTGAAVLSTGAAVRTGAGMVRYLGPGPATDLVRARWPEVVPGPGRVQAWVLGPGVDPDDAGQAEHVRTALAGEEPCLVDAGALGLLPDLLRSGDVAAPLLLTPHAGELARLLTDLGHDTDRVAVEADPLAHARRVADETGATVLVKGAVTLVVPADGEVVLSQADAPPWLATAGAGDVLAGVAGALLAAGVGRSDAGAMAAHVHGRAGWIASGGGPVSAGSVLEAVPVAIRETLDRPFG